MAFRLNTNLAELPLAILNQLSSCLNQNSSWLKLLDDDRKNAFYSSEDEIEKVSRQSNPAQAIIQRWGNRGQTVQSLIQRLQLYSFDRPQLVLKRKFKALRWAPGVAPIRIKSDDQEIVLKANAIGFPSAQFEWLRDGEPVGPPGNTLRINKCKCETGFEYVCRVWNEVEEGQTFSEYYRVEGKQFRSDLRSEPVDLSSFVQAAHACDHCKAAELEKIREKLGGTTVEDSMEKAPSEQVAAACEKLVAADKVALIISNCSYHHLPALRTPHCDAETLAAALQTLHFKTVTLADLTLPEMHYMLGEYKRLLGNDVYAVLYFAGHGFEVNGQCYLLPVEAPLEAHAPEHSLSMHKVLASLDSCAPALHLILLDVCRKFIPPECVPLFIEEAEKFQRRHRPNRNTVYGYSTSGGVGAYEVKGEINGVFMNALKGHIEEAVPVVEMLRRVFVDIDRDLRVQQVQIPELRTSLTKPRALTDQLVCDGHTSSFDQHNVHWTLMHELPMPVYVRFEEQQLMVTIWFDYCGRFTNKVYVFSSVDQLRAEDGDEGTAEGEEQALAHLAYLHFPSELETSNSRLVTDDQEGVSVCVLLSHLQKSKGPLECQVHLTESQSGKVVATREAALGHVLITRILNSLRRI
ncbi:hypothetical protein PMAYCL1PPCAC_09214 [Pristionchus mayeri]|uniref:Peptidase n=1 Tax=Pristionchus mayeri TaxID=1317129 RepID=A0AAN5CDS5_9BILA|nr:hypothetical protein PMAYCL1PPCAC_09214 [Pristionchus mayeri]